VRFEKMDPVGQPVGKATAKCRVPLVCHHTLLFEEMDPSGQDPSGESLVWFGGGLLDRLRRRDAACSRNPITCVSRKWAPPWQVIGLGGGGRSSNLETRKIKRHASGDGLDHPGRACRLRYVRFKKT